MSFFPFSVTLNTTFFIPVTDSVSTFFIVKSFISILFEYNCTKSIQTFTAPHDGLYMLEVWGAQGGGSGGKGGYWFTIDGKYTNWGNSSAYFIEMYPDYVHIGRYPGEVPAGTKLNIHFVITLNADHNKYVEFIVSAKA